MASLNKNEILAEMQSRTLRYDVTDISKPLKAILIDLSQRFPFLQKTSNATVALNGHSIALPANVRQVDSVYITATLAALTRVEHEQLLAMLSAESTSGTVDLYSLFNNTLYVWPPASAATQVTLAHSYLNDNDESIDFTDEFDEALIEGVCWKVYEGKGQLQLEVAQAHLALYQSAVEALQLQFKDRLETSGQSGVKA